MNELGSFCGICDTLKSSRAHRLKVTIKKEWAMSSSIMVLILRHDDPGGDSRFPFQLHTPTAADLSDYITKVQPGRAKRWTHLVPWVAGKQKPPSLFVMTAHGWIHSLITLQWKLGSCVEASAWIHWIYKWKIFPCSKLRLEPNAVGVLWVLC